MSGPGVAAGVFGSVERDPTIRWASDRLVDAASDAASAAVKMNRFHPSCLALWPRPPRKQCPPAPEQPVPEVVPPGADVERLS